MVQLSVNACVISKFSRGGSYNTKITGKDTEKLSRGGIYKPSIQSEILQNS